MAEAAHKVTLNVYDLSQGLARQLSSTFLGKVIEGVWHTGIVVYGEEYFFGGGIQHCPAGRTPYGKPVKVVELGETHVPKDLFTDFLREIGPRYTMETYSLFSHNCNNFSNEVSLFLVGVSIPDYILQLPNEVLNSPMSPLILPMIQQLETTLRAGAAPQPPQLRPQTSCATTRAPMPVLRPRALSSLVRTHKQKLSQQRMWSLQVGRRRAAAHPMDHLIPSVLRGTWCRRRSRGSSRPSWHLALCVQARLLHWRQGG